MAAVALVLGGWVDVYASFPNTSAYFSPLVGGPAAGYRWLADSDQDWGQWLPILARDWTVNGRPALVLSYSGAGDPAAYGMDYVDLFSPALVSRVRPADRLEAIPYRAMVAVGTKLLQIQPKLYAWPMANLKPLPRRDPCYIAWDISGNPEAFRWLAAIYEAMGRDRHRGWALAAAKAAEGQP